MIKRLILILLILTGLAVPAQSQDNPPNNTVTQTDLIIGLVDGLGWSFGLPDQPGIEDYLKILRGRRSWRFEVEDIYVPDIDALLVPKEIRTFGSFSGTSWQRAPANQIEAELEFILPISGTYEIRAALTKPGYHLTIDGHEFSADGERNFSEVTFGTVDLAAGQHTAKMIIPARGGLDYLLLDAPPAKAIEPIGGWSPENKLTAFDLAVTISRLLDLESTLPALNDIRLIEAEDAPVPENASISDDSYHGPTHGKWVNAGMRTARYSHLFEVNRPGYYELSLDLFSNRPVNGTINGKQPFTVTPPPFFRELSAGSFYFEKGVNQIDIDLPSRSGFDRFSLKAKASEKSDILRLTGISAASEIDVRELDHVLQLVAAIGVHR